MIMKRKLSPSRMVEIRPGIEAGTWFERPLRWHLRHLHLYVLGGLRASETLRVGEYVCKSSTILCFYVCALKGGELRSLTSVFLLSFMRTSLT